MTVAAETRLAASQRDLPGILMLGDKRVFPGNCSCVTLPPASMQSTAFLLQRMPLPS